ncbi:Hypothetical predicted protein [Mytilus galloprovincialis]|uniref:Rieske domain-containing protein n=1 Tax=Mytilus galloprovincialis TaxID=29158 RepID=A0A8B6GGC0_MYTGA|nr:Hypothetical predicted protein [Mytilus galloprovincialis]
MQSSYKIFIPVDGIKYSDLFDWSDPSQKCKVVQTSIQRPGLLRQNSRTGSLINCNEQKIALFRHGGDVFAINEKCPHAGGPLHLGDIEEMPDNTLCIRCPWHSWRFDLLTGKVRMPKGQNRAAKVYPVTVGENGKLSIGFDEFNARYFSGDIDF